MSDKTKPVREQELSVDIDAPLEAVWKAISEGDGVKNWFAPQASLTKPGVGGELTVAWTPEIAFTTTIGAWQPNRHLQWTHDDMMGPGTRFLVDYYLSTENGKTRVRFVQSAFGESEGWDDLFAGTEVGWTYFLYNLRLYVEKHLGHARRMISARFPSGVARDAAWRKLVSAAAGLVIATSATVKAGDWVQLKLDDPATLRAIVDLVVDGHAIAMRIPELNDAVLFIELEGSGQEGFSIGMWLSVYDDGHAARIDSPAQRAFERVKAAVR
jgi:uncharacterized protein YndB with AHSA1/START domain